MVYRLPAIGELDWGEDINDSIAAVKAIADAAETEAGSQAKANVARDFARARGNHTGSQVASTISDFSAAVNNIVGPANDGTTAVNVETDGSLTRTALESLFTELPSLSENVVYVTARGDDASDGRSLATAKASIASGLTALAGEAGRIQLGYGDRSTAATHTLPSGTQIVGAGQGMSGLEYTGTGALFQGDSGTRTYNQAIMDVAISGPGSGTTAVAFDMVDCSQVTFSGFVISNFGVGLKNRSTTSGWAVYNRGINGFFTSCGTGIDFGLTGSNGSGWAFVKFGGCDIGVNIIDSNQNHFHACQFEVNTTGVFIDATLAGRADHNSFSYCRFETNTSAWTVNSANVRGTVIDKPATFGTYTFTDSGARTFHDTSGSSRSFRQATLSDALGSWRFERTASGGSSLPAMVVCDAATGSGTPVTIQAETERSAGSFFRGTRGGTTYFDVTAAGAMTFPQGGSITIGTAAVRPIQWVQADADVTRNNTAVLADDPTLTLPVVANGVYRVNAMLFYNAVASTTGDSQWKFSAPAGATMTWLPDSLPAASTAATSGRDTTAKNLSNTTIGGGIGVKVAFRPSGLLRVSSTAGNLTIQWAQNVAEVSDLIRCADSWLELVKVN